MKCVALVPGELASNSGHHVKSISLFFFFFLAESPSGFQHSLRASFRDYPKRPAVLLVLKEEEEKKKQVIFLKKK